MMLRPFICLPVAAAALLSAVAEALPQGMEAAFETYTALPSVLLPPLQSAKDKASADAAAPRLKEALEKLYDARAQLQALNSLTAEQKAEAEKRYGMKMRQEWGKVYEEMFRIQKEKCFGSAEFSRLYSVMGLMLGK